jgi:hypothetical protein
MKSLSENSRRQVCKPLPLRGYTGWSQLAAGRKDNAYRPISAMDYKRVRKAAFAYTALEPATIISFQESEAPEANDSPPRSIPSRTGEHSLQSID